MSLTLNQAGGVRGQNFEGYMAENDSPVIGHHKMLLNTSSIVSKAGDGEIAISHG
jgi:hypothetical protein